MQSDVLGVLAEYIEADNFFEGNPFIVLRHEGFQLEGVDGASGLYSFNVKTFHTFVKNRSTEVEIRPVNAFLRSQDDEFKKEYTAVMTVCSLLVKQTANTPAEVYRILEEIRDQLNDFDRKFGFCKRINAWVHKCVEDGSLPMADMSDAGKRPQDRADMTFVREEAITLTGVAVLYKLIAPITGDFIYHHSATINGQFKETLVASTTTDLLKRNYLKIIQKLYHYIGKLVANKVHSNQDVALHYKGLTTNHITREVADMILVKKFVSLDLHKEDGSIIKYVASCVKSYIESQLRNGSASYNMKFYNDPKDGDIMSGSEETNSSRVEVESSSSRKPAIVYPIANMAAQWIVDQYLEAGKVDKQRYFEALDYYNDYPVLITPISQAIVGNYFGEELCGAKSIYLISGQPMVRLVTLLQCLFVESKAKWLPHALSMTVAIHERVGGLNDFAITNAWKASAEYAELRKTVANGYGEVAWDASLKEINTQLTEKPMLYHTAPSIWEGVWEKHSDLNRENYPNRDGQDLSAEDRLALLCETTSLYTELWKKGKWRPESMVA